MSSERTRPRLIPVLDVKNGRVVRAVGGRRDEYRPVVSRLTASTEPVEVARALLEATGASELYVADLDAIIERPAGSPAVRSILDEFGVATWLDAGIGRTDVLDLPPHLHLRPVVGFETCRKPELLLETLIEPIRRPVAFSLDLRQGRLVGNWKAWGLRGEHDALALVRRVVAMGVRTLFVLDLARVGLGQGSGTEALLGAIRAELPEVELIAGGGVRTWADIDRLGDAGADAVLVASAVHDRTLTLPRPSPG